jgi:hypothetical protein
MLVPHFAAVVGREPFNPVTATENALRHDPAAKDASDRSQAWPARITRQPKARHTQVVWNRTLIGIGKRLSNPANRSAWSTGEAFKRQRRRDLANDSGFTQVRVSTSRQSDQATARGQFLSLVVLGR